MGVTRALFCDFYCVFVAKTPFNVMHAITNIATDICFEFCWCFCINFCHIYLQRYFLPQTNNYANVDCFLFLRAKYRYAGQKNRNCFDGNKQTMCERVV